MKPANPKTIVLSCKAPIDWQSVEAIVGRIEKFWLQKSSKRSPVPLLRIDEAPELLAHHELLAQARQIVFTQIHYFNFKAIVRILREIMGVQARFIVHTHGEFSKGALTLAEVREQLTNQDLFIVSCQAERAAARLSYSNINLCCAPFPMAQKKTSTEARPRLQPCSHLVYAGRLSEQKNIQQILHALVLLRVDGKIDWRLRIYGLTDGRGSAHVGLPRDSSYMRRIQKELKRLRLERHVELMGAAPEARWLRQQKKRDAIFVSASTHVDENFGLAAFRVVENGGRAVLSGWGGHLDLVRRFPAQVRGVPCYYSAGGVFLKPQDLARAIKDVSRRPSLKLPAARLEDYGFDSYERALKSALKKARGKTKPLSPTPLVARLTERQKQNHWKPLQVFSGYDDPLIYPFHEAYGARRSSRR